MPFVTLEMVFPSFKVYYFKTNLASQANPKVSKSVLIRTSVTKKTMNAKSQTTTGGAGTKRQQKFKNHVKCVIFFFLSVELRYVLGGKEKGKAERRRTFTSL